MKNWVCAAVLGLSLAGPVGAGGLSAPVVEPDIIVEGASGSGQFTLPFLLLVLIAAVVSGG